LVAEGLTAVISLLIPFILCFTVIASVGLGILAAYIAVLGILSTFPRPSPPEPALDHPQLALVPNQNHVSGD
jgi:hypothetical protein